jgi:hypothetical protein
VGHVDYQIKLDVEHLKVCPDVILEYNRLTCIIQGFNGAIGSRVTGVLNSAQQWQNVLLCPNVWIITYLLRRGAFRDFDVGIASLVSLYLFTSCADTREPCSF